MLGYDKAQKMLEERAQSSPREIISRLVEADEKWAGARPPDDDVTFVVLKFKADNVGNLL